MFQFAWDHMEIYLVDKSDITPKMSPMIRAHIAWELFIPGSPGEFPEGHGRVLYPFSNWIWDEFGKVGGYLNKNSKDAVYVSIPELSPHGRDFLVRLCSMWSDEIFFYGKNDENLWIPPLVNIFTDSHMDNAEKRVADKEEGGSERFFMPLLGPSRSFFRLEKISPGNSSARLHSHSAVDEYYLLIRGKATLKIGSRSIPIEEGTLVGKPTGPDLTSQIIADRNDEVEVLDMEVWPDRYYNAKDAVLYPEHGELFMRGTGWGSIIPWITAMNTDDFRRNYDTSYGRNADGSWSPEKFRGHKERKNMD